MKKQGQKRPLAVLVTLSLLVAISIICGKYLAIRGGDILRFSFENLPIILAGILFGPLGGAATGIVADLVGCLLVAYPINPIVTLGAAVIGLVSGVLWQGFVRLETLSVNLRLALVVCLSHFAGSVLIKTFGLAAYYSYPLEVLFLWRLLNYVIIGVMESILLCLLFRNQFFKKQLVSSAKEKAKMNYNEALSYIHAINWTFCKPGLERVSMLCEKLGDPQKDVKYIHVAGTNGKGSSCAMLSSILREAGYRVGLYTSPHMVRFNERMQVNGECISDEDLARITEEVKPFADSMEDRPTEFELVTAIAFLYFKRMHCDIVILETGLGGRLDATNVIEKPVVSVITGIDLDHTAILGDTYDKIAFEKAGIIKSGCPVVLGDCNADARAVLLQRAKECGSEARIADASAILDVAYSLEGSTFSYKEYKELSLSLSGIYQPKNCATVLECVETLRACGYTVTDDAVRRGLSSVRWMGRFEVLSKEPLVIYDGGHNPEGVTAFVESLVQMIPDRRVCLVCGVLRDKDYAHMVEALGRITDRVFTLTIDNPRALPADELAAILGENGMEATACSSPEEAVKAAFAYAAEKKIPLVMNGSLYMYSEVIDTVKELLNK